MAEKYTPQGLPIISSSTFKVFLRDTRVRDEIQLQEWLRIIKEENPGVADYLQYISDVTGDFPTNARSYMLQTAMGLYMMIRRQAEANKLEERYTEH